MSEWWKNNPESSPPRLDKLEEGFIDSDLGPAPIVEAFDRQGSRS